MSHPFNHLNPDDVVLDRLPEPVVATMEQRNRWLSSVPYDGNGLEFLIADTQAWAPGQTVRVAFLGGTVQLHERIEEVINQIMGVSNLTLDFGFDPAMGSYRTWSESDTVLAADIRVSFDLDGYFSLVGTDSANPLIGSPLGNVGGRAHQRSLNLGGFDESWPVTGEGTVLHEFLHALAFHHEHQNMRGPCESSFRWDDDPGYVSTQDAFGRFIPDGQGRRPGIYSYLSGFPNFWSVAQINHNLRTPSESTGFVAGPFDRASVMLYRFPTSFYRTHPSPCAPDSDGQSLSNGDTRGLQLLYPGGAVEVADIASRRESLLETLTAASPSLEALEAPVGGASFADQVAETLRRGLEG